MKALYIPNLDVKDITDQAKKEFHATITNLGDFFGGYPALKKMRRKKPEKREKLKNGSDCINFFNYLETQAKAQGTTFDKLMKNWYPELSIYSSTEDIKNVIKMNLMGETSSEKEFSIDRFTLLQSALSNDTKSKISCLKIVCQSGWAWFSESARITLLENTAKKNIPIQIIVNSDAIEDIASTMRNPEYDLRYKGFNETLEEWHKYEEAYDSISLKVSQFPIFKKIFIIEYEDHSADGLIRDYIYGSPSSADSPSQQITEKDTSMAFYQTEFNFLWDHAQAYDEWHRSKSEQENTTSKTMTAINTKKSSFGFLHSCMEHNAPIKSIRMAYQSGWAWFSENSRIDLIERAAKDGIPIKIIANPKSVIEKIGFSMRDSEKILRYKGFNETLEEWHKYEKTYDCINLKISDYPILRKTTIIEFENGTTKALLRDYNYGLPANDTSPFTELNEENPALNCYQSEFDFLWEHAKTYEEWYKSEPKQEEVITPGKYLLIHPSYDSNLYSSERGNPTWEYSALSIEEDNTARLKIGTPNFDEEAIGSSGYAYNGHVKLTQKNIFISLSDNTEVKNIILLRPLRGDSRYIGIITGLHPATGQPVALKCACISQPMFKNINVSLLNTLLGIKDNSYKTTIDEGDINLFYSNKIFVKASR